MTSSTRTSTQTTETTAATAAAPSTQHQNIPLQNPPTSGRERGKKVPLAEPRGGVRGGRGGQQSEPPQQLYVRCSGGGGERRPHPGVFTPAGEEGRKTGEGSTAWGWNVVAQDSCCMSHDPGGEGVTSLSKSDNNSAPHCQLFRPKSHKVHPQGVKVRQHHGGETGAGKPGQKNEEKWMKMSRK